MIVDIENAVLDRIQSANDGRLGYRIATLETYGGEFDDEISQVVRQLPGVWVVYAGGGKPAPYGASKTRWRMPATFVVMVGARSVRSEPFSRRGLEVAGQVREVGAYRMLEDCRRLLLNQDFGLPIARFEPGSVKTLYNLTMNGLALSAFAQEWHTAFIVEPDAAADGDWLRIGINYHLVPDDGKPDASDLVTLNP
ncbi:phage protein Gp37 [Chitinivorax sp. PXF-14]|uniref:phage protein Gp37 n=1 Tax=Chitinivorax sp. PXF-14 TaxID=3230488 RepID=UPI0034654547